MIPIILPSTSRRVVALSNTSTRLPSLVYKRNSKFEDSIPWSAFSSTALTDALYSSVIKSRTKSCPSTSSFLNPVILAAVWFHSLIRPSASMPKIGAFAVSMNWVNSAAMRSDSSWAILASVISWPTPMTPIILPSTSRRVVALSHTSTRLPSLVYKGNSKFEDSIPWSAFSSTALTDALYSSVIKSRTKSCPSTSSFLNPVILAAVWFHSLIRPSASMPKIGAFAVSMNWVNSAAMRSDSSWAILASVISWPTPMTPIILPSTSRRVVALSNTLTRVPSLVYKGNS